MDVEIILEDIGIDYFQAGERYMVCCPFHDDANPSCGLWEDSGYFKCFACGEEGSLVEFVAQVLDISIREAVRKVKGQDNISDLEDNIGRFLDKDTKVLKYFKWDSFCSVYPPVIPETSAWTYLKDRGITDESILRFSMRWGGDTGKYRYRVILPIRTVEGKLLAYVGRAIKNEMVPKTRKCRSPHRTFFGLCELVEKAKKVPYLIVTEGEFDAIYLQQFGIPAVANMGTIPFGPDKIRLLRRYTRKVVLSYDGDEAGQKAMDGDGKRRGALEEMSRHMPTVSVRLPDGCDPNDLSAKEVNEIYGEWRLSCLIS